MKRIQLKYYPKPTPTNHHYTPRPDLAREASLRARIDALWRSGKTDEKSGLPAFLDRRLWEREIP